jgi:hypothetical protein
MTAAGTSPAARLRSTLAWEQHCCLPLEADCDIAPLRRYLDVGVSYLSVNVGYAPHGIEETVRVLASWRRQVQRSEEFVLATTADDVLAAQQSGRLAVGFDLEDTGGQFPARRPAGLAPMTTAVTMAALLTRRAARRPAGPVPSRRRRRRPAGGRGRPVSPACSARGSSPWSPRGGAWH